MVLVSNNRYRLGRAVGSGTRPRIDDGLLGITVVAEPSEHDQGVRRLQRPLREWSAPGFEVDADSPVPAGIDGEALVLDPPLRFRIRPGVLRVRIARQHPGASPSALAPEGMWAGVVQLARSPLAATRNHHRQRQGGPNGADGDHPEGAAGGARAAARLHPRADALSSRNDVEFQRNSLLSRCHVPDEVDFKLEIEIEDDERELEIELKW